MTRYDTFRKDRERIAKQTEAEFALAACLEAQGIDCAAFIANMGRSVHEFNVVAHYLHGVNDEQPTPNLLESLKKLWDSASCLTSLRQNRDLSGNPNETGVARQWSLEELGDVRRPAKK